MSRLSNAQVAYIEAFKLPPPEPFGINDEEAAQVLENAVASGAPVPDDFDWWAEMPPDALA